MIIYVGTKDSPGNKNSDEIAEEIVEFTNSVKTSKIGVFVSSIVSKKRPV